MVKKAAEQGNANVQDHLNRINNQGFATTQTYDTEFQETEFDEQVKMYANADINVRETPTNDTQDNIISSYDRGDEVIVVGKTDQYYKVYKNYDIVSNENDLIGYVMKQFLSNTYEEAMNEMTKH